MTDDQCFFATLKLHEEPFPQSPCSTSKHGSPSLKQQLSKTVPLPSDMRSRKQLLVKARQYPSFSEDTSISAAVLVACLSRFRGWESHLFNYLAAANRDDNIELLSVDHDEGYDNIDPDVVCELYAHVLCLAMTRHFLSDDHVADLFEGVLAEKQLLDAQVPCPTTWIKSIRDQMQVLPRLSSCICRFLMSSTERACRNLLRDLRGSEMATFKSCIHFTYYAPKTAAHVQRYILHEMLLLRKHVTKIKTLPKDERELVALLYPGEFLPPIHVYSNLAFCAVFQYRKGEKYADVIDCPHKEELKVFVRTKLKGPLTLSQLAPVERTLLEETGVTEDFQEESGPLLVDCNTPRLTELLRALVAEIRNVPRDPVESIDSITL